MAMNKKEQAAYDAAIRSAEVNRALRWSDYSTKTDVPPPKGTHKLTKGWTARFWIGCDSIWRAVGKACSSSIYHGFDWEKTSSQNPKSLYSTRLLALQSARRQAEIKFAEMLADFDAEIEKEIENPTPGPE